jgi:hypothetical protein
MFAADAGKLWVLNGVQGTRCGIERKVGWLSAGEISRATCRPVTPWRQCEGIG